MDLTATIEPRSDQLNADDLMAGPRVVTITDVQAGDAEQPVKVVTAEYGAERPFKPSKSMRRIMVAAWGKDSSAYIGQSMTLYRDPTITFGKDEVGGIRISHMTGLEKPLRVALTVTRGKRKPYVVEPLQVTAPELLPDDLDGLRAAWRTHPERRAEIEARIAAMPPAQDAELVDAELVEPE